MQRLNINNKIKYNGIVCFAHSCSQIFIVIWLVGCCLVVVFLPNEKCHNGCWWFAHQKLLSEIRYQNETLSHMLHIECKTIAPWRIERKIYSIKTCAYNSRKPNNFLFGFFYHDMYIQLVCILSIFIWSDSLDDALVLHIFFLNFIFFVSLFFGIVQNCNPFKWLDFFLFSHTLSK